MDSKSVDITDPAHRMRPVETDRTEAEKPRETARAKFLLEAPRYPRFKLAGKTGTGFVIPGAGNHSMDDWKKVMRWAAQQQQEEKHETRDYLRRTIRLLPLIAVTTVPFGWLAFVTLDGTLATLCTLGVLVVSCLIAEHLA